MAQFVVRNLEEDVRNKLREIARSQGQSMEETIRQILRRAVMGKKASPSPLGSRLAQRFASNGLDKEIPELRGQSLDPPSLDR